MKIKRVELFHVCLPMKFEFITAKESLSVRETLIIKLTNEKGMSGFGECAAFTTPFYTAETLSLAKKVLTEKYLPLLLKADIAHPFDIHNATDEKLPMAAAGVENALLALYAFENDENIISSLFSERLHSSVKMGMVLGDLPYQDLAERVRTYRAAGCNRFKIKIKPVDSYEKMERLTASFPDINFLTDANRSFRISQMHLLKRFDKLKLLCIEEPFMFHELMECTQLQKQFRTPICLDESIQTMGELKRAAELNMFQMLNIKIGRVGGLYYAKKMISFCRKNGIGFWIGSMVESGISKILHLQLAALPDVVMPGDLSDSRRYFENDLIDPPIAFTDGEMKIPTGNGIGVRVDERAIADYCIDTWVKGN